MKALLIERHLTFIDESGDVYSTVVDQTVDLSDVKNYILNDDLESLKGLVLKEFSTNTEQLVKVQKDMDNHTLHIGRLVNNKVFNEFFECRAGVCNYKGKREVTLPEELLKQMVDSHDKGEDIKPYVRFWELCLQNPNPNSRAGLFKFVKRQKLIITTYGYIVCYRRAMILDSVNDSRLQDFVTSSLLKIRSQRGSTSRYYVAISCDGLSEYILLDSKSKKFENAADDGYEILGNIKDLKKILQEKPQEIYTDNHTRRMRFKLGDVVSIQRSLCDEDPNIECSRGLHIGSKSFIRDNESFGQKILVCLVNPKNVVSVPYADAHKMRVCEYKIIASFDDFKNIEEFEQTDLRVFEDDYIDYDLNELANKLKETKFEKNEDYSLIKMKIDELEKLKRLVCVEKSTLLESKKYLS